MDDATRNSLKERSLPLGRFARASQLSRKALRLYDELGILVPDHVDPFSGYRYYNPEQLEKARFIRLLREMEMPLVEIGLPIAGEIEPSGEMRVRDIPAHQAAYGTTPPEQSQFPEIIEAWDAVVAWVQHNKFTMSESPVPCYEVWHQDRTITIVQPFENGR